MAKVRITALGEARSLAGWSSQEFEFNGGCVGDLFKQVTTAHNSRLYDVVTENDRLKGKFFVILNGCRQECSEVLTTGLKADDHVVIMEKVKIMG